MEFASKVTGWRGLTPENVVLKAWAEWGIENENLPRLRTSVKLVMAARMSTTFNLLETIQPLLPTMSAVDMCRRIVEEVVFLAAAQ